MSRDLSTADRDALVMYNGACYLTTRMDPGPERLQGTAAYRRGQTLHDAIYGPILPAHLDPHYQRSTGASLQFEELYGPSSQPGICFSEAISSGVTSGTCRESPGSSQPGSGRFPKRFAP